MKPGVAKRQRCAIYTRKSTEHNLDLAFNSLDAQRESCEAYIKSQAHEGWTLVRDRFDDGGLSGASLARPALQELLAHVRARHVDVIVVYKVDRLTRSLADFAKLVELFDEYEVSFVSITQSFNTTSSMGRLTLNVLLSFAQFEREVIGERVRDKIAASKRKGIWVGGPVPLGYRSVNKKLEIVPEDAATVRRIFTDYLRLGSIVALATELEREGIRPKARKPAAPDAPAPRFGSGGLSYLLKNRCYIGEVVYRGEVHKGEHETILDRDLFEAVQLRLVEQASERIAGRRSLPALLTGKLFDDRGNPMTPTHTNKRGVRYRYYVSQALLQGRKAEAGTVARVSAADIEGAVTKVLLEVNGIGDGTERSDREIVNAGLSRAMIRRTEVALHIRRPTVPIDEMAEKADDVGETIITIPFSPAMTPRKGVAHAPTRDRVMDDASRVTLLRAISRARGWVDAMIADSSLGFATIAAREGLGVTYVRRLASFTFISPQIVQAIAEGRAPSNLTATKMLTDLPLSWIDQERRYLEPD